jgi:hypothetical protein
MKQHFAIFFRLCMANLPDSQTESALESSLKSEDDDALDPRVQVCDIQFYHSSLLSFI